MRREASQTQSEYHTVGLDDPASHPTTVPVTRLQLTSVLVHTVCLLLTAGPCRDLSGTGVQPRPVLACVLISSFGPSPLALIISS